MQKVNPFDALSVGDLVEYNWGYPGVNSIMLYLGYDPNNRPIYDNELYPYIFYRLERGDISGFKLSGNPGEMTFRILARLKNAKEG